VFSFAALHAARPERDRFIERARFFFSSAVETLKQMRTRTLARPVVVLLSSGLILPWTEARPNETAPQPIEAGRFPPQERFVPQRQEAVRRAKLLLASGAALLVAIALVSYWLMGL